MSLNWLLVFIPIGVGLDWCGASPMLVFMDLGAGDRPAGGVDGRRHRGTRPVTWARPSAACSTPRSGNAPEIIISSFALHAGLVNIVKSSLTGSIIGNLLFGLGISFFAGGIKFGRDQRFDPQAARMTTRIADAGLVRPDHPGHDPVQRLGRAVDQPGDARSSCSWFTWRAWSRSSRIKNR